MKTKISPQKKVKLKPIQAALSGMPPDLDELFSVIPTESREIALQKLQRLASISILLKDLEDLEKKYHAKSE